MHHEHARGIAGSRERVSLLGALMARLRGRADRRVSTAEADLRLDRSQPTGQARDRWAEIARGLHHPDEPVVLDEEGSRE
ncbi:hypothetical protein [Longimicrobium sp.]|uniref:hypothetical protein n=1 Tax=Longimicrobium sp. TaxID=2029185 RepID=UPI002E365E33|nr:hypothetical protein [Longimicrobium sp.]HEX6041200.1 hypothetical protein [Longimicrobium sp.]